MMGDQETESEMQRGTCACGHEMEEHMNGSGVIGDCAADTLMPRKKPIHGGARPNAGRPTTTGMASTPPIHYRVSADQLADLSAEGRTHKPKLSPSQVAKLRAFPRTSKTGTTP